MNRSNNYRQSAECSLRQGALKLVTLLLILLSSTFPSLAGGSIEGIQSRNSGKEILEASYSNYENGNWLESLDGLHTYLRRYGKSGKNVNSSDLVRAYFLLSRIHIGFGDYTAAEKYYLDALALAEKNGMERMKLNICGNLSITYCHLGNEQKAREYLERARAAEVDDRKAQIYSTIIADAYIERIFGDRDRSIAKMKGLLQTIDSIQLGDRARTSPLSEITEMYEESNRPDSALKYLTEYEQLARRYNVLDMMTDCKRLYMRIYTQKGETAKALEYQKEYIDLRDSLMNHGNLRLISGKYDSQAAELPDDEHPSLRLSFSRLQVILFLLGSLLLVVAVAACVYFFQRRRVREAYIRLYEKNREIMQEKDHEDETEEDARMRNMILSTVERNHSWRDPDFTPARLAQLTGLDSKELSRILGECLGKNFRSFINDYRIREAQKLLSQQSDAPVLTPEEIGRKVGYRSEATFIAAFCKQTGLPPEIYRMISEHIRREKSKKS